MTIDHPVLRASPICPLCLEFKPEGALTCWPCHRVQKEQNNGGYSAHAVARMATIGVYLDVAMAAHRLLNPNR